MNGDTPELGTTLLKGAHVIDPSQGLNGVADVLIKDGVIAAIGDLPPQPDAKVIDASGKYLSPGWVDIHVHAFGPLGFADLDSIGICQGVTTFIDAGGAGVSTIDEFVGQLEGRTKTSLYCGPYIRPMGIIALGFIEGDVRTLGSIPITQWLDTVSEHRDLLRYLKIGAFENYGTGPLKLGKGLAETVGLPMYSHVGELNAGNQTKGAMEIFDVSQSGDIITHIYHNNLGRILDEDGKVLPIVRDAERRGVLFDIGFGAYNFSWDLSEKAYAQGICPHIISSDLQQFNVAGPVYSLANVLGVFLHLGLSMNEIIERVTIAPAKYLKLDDRAGSLRPGMPADITVFSVESGEYQVRDGFRTDRTTHQKIVPHMAFKRGARVDCDLERCQDERNWLMQIADDAPPTRALALSDRHKAFIGALESEINGLEWEASPYNFDQAHKLQAAFHRARRAQDMALPEALMAAMDCFLASPFTIQIGMLLVHLEKDFIRQRLRDVAGHRAIAA